MGIISSINNIIVEMVNGISKIDIIDLKNRKLLILIPEEEFSTCRLTILDLAKRISRLLSTYLNIRGNVVCSRKCVTLKEARYELEKCKNTYKKRFYSDVTLIAYNSDFEFNRLKKNIRYDEHIKKLEIILKAAIYAVQWLF